MKILVASEVLDIDQALRSLPEVIRNIACGLAGQTDRLASRKRLDINVHAPLVRLHERKCLAVRRDAKVAALGMVEEIAHWDPRLVGGARRWQRDDLQSAQHEGKREGVPVARNQHVYVLGKGSVAWDASHVGAGLYALVVNICHSFVIARLGALPAWIAKGRRGEAPGRNGPPVEPEWDAGSGDQPRRERSGRSRPARRRPAGTARSRM